MVSANFTDCRIGRSAESSARRVALSVFAVLALMLASGSAFPLSGWLRDLACFMACVCFLVTSSSSRGPGAMARFLLAPGLFAALCLCLAVRAPAPRLALLAWVFIGEFWVERSLGGKRRGGGSEMMLLGAIGVICAMYIVAGARSPLVWAVMRGLQILSRYVGLTPWKVAAYELSAAVAVAALVVMAGRYTRLSARYALRLTAGCVLLTMLVLLQPVGCRVNAARAGDDEIPRQPLSVAFYSEGLLDWEVPSAGKLGIIRSGMFGLFRKSLERHAHSRGGSVLDVDSLTAGALSRVDLMVFINPTRGLAPAERRLLAGFVASGGGLLVLGDHTDIGGSRAPLNSALDFTSMRFNFDSAVSMRERWKGCLEILPHPVTAGVDDEMDAQLGTGASLEIHGSAFAVVTGRYAFSDCGDYANGGRGAQMGNCRHDAGEAFGDVVLVAGEEVGSGRVLVFGDTSPFQNGARFLSQRLVSNSVHWVSGEDALCAEGGVSDIRPFDDVAIVDFGACPKISRELFTDRSLGGLANCLFRAGLTPVPACGGSPDGAAFAFLVEPTRHLGAAGTRRLTEYMLSGGNLILAKGYSWPEPCAGLLGAAGFALEPVPLGRGEASSGITYGEAYAATYDGAADTVLHAQAFGRPTVITRPFGYGSFTLIADGRFLLDANLEGETAAVAENVRFLAALLCYIRKERRDLVPTDRAVAGNNPH